MTETDLIMMIEDDEGHARLIEKNIRRSGMVNPIDRCPDGTTALASLFGDGERGPAHARPALILLDLNLPDMTGADILKRIKENPSVRHIPVIVLTTTDDKLEIQRCYDLGCNAYLTKPLVDQRFANAIRQLGQFLSVMQVPEPVRV